MAIRKLSLHTGALLYPQLPTAITDNDGPAKVFDHLILRMQLALLRAERSFLNMAENVTTLAALMESKSVIPMIQVELPLLEEMPHLSFGPMSRWQRSKTSESESARW